MSNSNQVASYEPDKIIRNYYYKEENEKISYPIYNFLIHQFDFFSENCPILNKCFKINCKEMDFNSCSCEKGICALGTQCKVSALVFNSIMGEPDTDVNPKSFQEMEEIIKDMEDNTFINFCIAVNSIKPKFVGHRFNIVCLKENEIYTFFRIQSYVNCYPFSYEELSYSDLKEQMIGFINIFLDKGKFTNNQGKIWKTFTGEKLSIGNDKPETIHVFNYYIYEINDLEEWKEKIINNIRRLIKETKDITNELKFRLEMFDDSFIGDFSLPSLLFKNIINKLIQTQSNLQLKMEKDDVSKKIDVLISNDKVNMSQYKKNEIFNPKFLNNQPIFSSNNNPYATSINQSGATGKRKNPITNEKLSSSYIPSEEIKSPILSKYNSSRLLIENIPTTVTPQISSGDY